MARKIARRPLRCSRRRVADRARKGKGGRTEVLKTADDGVASPWTRRETGPLKAR